jgi:hypothetical protein
MRHGKILRNKLKEDATWEDLEELNNQFPEFCTGS